MKYYGIAGLGALLITGIVGWQVLAPGQKINTVEPVEQTTGEAAKLDQDLLRTKQLAASLDGIAARAFEPRSNAPVIGFVRMSEAEKLRRASNPGGLAMNGEGDEVPQYQREVSLLYSGRGFNRAVVDGKYIRSGGTLPDGSKVVKITRDSVIIKTQEGRKVLRVKDPRTVRPVTKEQKP